MYLSTNYDRLLLLSFCSLVIAGICVAWSAFISIFSWVQLSALSFCVIAIIAQVLVFYKSRDKQPNHENDLRQRLHKAEDELEKIKIGLELEDFLYALYDPEDRLIWANQAYKGFYETEISQLGEHFRYHELIRLQLELGNFDGDIDAEVQSRVLAQRNGDGKPKIREYGKGRTMSVSKYKCHNGCIAGVAFDVSDFERRQRALIESERRAIGFLETDVVDATENVTGMTTNVRSLLSNVSHSSNDVQSKTTSIYNFATTLSESLRSATELTRSGARETKNGQQAVRSAEQAFVKLLAAIGSISNITDSIDSISRRTRLLALNASVEAARAGQAGKGFSVVASEVKLLSNEAEEATAAIQEQIGDFQSIAKETETSMELALRSIGSITDASDNLVTVLSDQEMEADKLNTSLSALERAAEHIVHSTEELSIAADSMDETSTVLREKIDKAISLSAVAS